MFFASAARALAFIYSADATAIASHMQPARAHLTSTDRAEDREGKLQHVLVDTSRQIAHVDCGDRHRHTRGGAKCLCEVGLHVTQELSVDHRQPSLHVLTNLSAHYCMHLL